MTKKELIEALETYDDDETIFALAQLTSYKQEPVFIHDILSEKKSLYLILSD